MYKRFVDRYVVVTGAAGGLGRALAEGFGQEGAFLILIDANQRELETTAKILDDQGVSSSTHVVNLAVERDIHEVAALIGAEHERIDVLLNNAGIAYGEINQRFETLPQEKWLHFLSVNMLAPLFLGQALRPSLAKAKGVIINQTSSASFVPAHTYGITKAGLNSMTLGMAHAFAVDSIRVNAIAPGIMETPASTSRLSPETYARVQGTQLLKLHGTAQHIVSLSLYLASDEAEFINAEIVSCDAGMSLRGWRY